jgi:predicted Mrr-cat superfamily restriction endonuclease
MTNVPLPRWKLLENAVAAIERSLTTVENTKVVPNASVPERVGGTLRQVDVYVEIPTGVRTVRVGVEVRDKADPLDLVEVEQLVAKLKKVDVDCGCIVSTSGFTASAKQEAARNGVQIRTIDEVGHPDWWLAPAMVLDLAQVELLHWQVNFHTDGHS